MNLKEYVQQIKAHRMRMRRWANVYAASPEAMRAVARTLAVHDVEKWLFLPLLFIFREGKRNRKLARLVYDIMNLVGNVIRFFALLFFSRAVTTEAKRAERIFDCLDRNLDPMARVELGDSGCPPPLDFFLKGQMLVEAHQYAKFWYEISKA